MSDFVTLKAVEILGDRVIPVEEFVIVNVRRINTLRVMGAKYRKRFGNDADTYYATAYVAPGTFRDGTLLARPPAIRSGDKGLSVVHWWLDRATFDRLMGVTHHG